MIPVFINVFNRLSTTVALAEQVSKLAHAVPILIDNNSDYEPLVDWYSRCEYEVVLLGENIGHHAPWRRVIPHDSSEFEGRYGTTRYVVTDCDLDISECPEDTLEVIEEPFFWREGIVKSGLSLRIDDLPEWQKNVIEWESRWWKKPTADGRFFIAPIDTTFAMYDCRTSVKKATSVVGVPAVRSAPPYVARHIPWYLNGENLDEENRNYFRTAGRSNSWKPDGKGLRSPYS